MSAKKFIIRGYSEEGKPKAETIAVTHDDEERSVFEYEGPSAVGMCHNFALTSIPIKHWVEKTNPPIEFDIEGFGQ